MKLLLVLGCKIVYDERKERYIPGPILEERLEKAIDVYIELDGECIIIVSGGSSSSRKISEAEVMKQYLVKRGVPGYKIFIENNSKNTIENCIESFHLFNIMKGRLTYQEVSSPNAFCTYYGNERFGFIEKFEKIIIISSDFHIPRVIRIFTRYNQTENLCFISSITATDQLESCIEKEIQIARKYT